VQVLRAVLTFTTLEVDNMDPSLLRDELASALDLPAWRVVVVSVRAGSVVAVIHIEPPLGLHRLPAAESTALSDALQSSALILPSFGPVAPTVEVVATSSSSPPPPPTAEGSLFGLHDWLEFLPFSRAGNVLMACAVALLLLLVMCATALCWLQVSGVPDPWRVRGGGVSPPKPANPHLSLYTRRLMAGRLCCAGSRSDAGPATPCACRRAGLGRCQGWGRYGSTIHVR